MNADPSLRPKNRIKPWTSRSIGSRFHHWIFYTLIRWGGVRVAYPVLYGVVLYYMACRPSIRKKTRFYLSRRFPSRKRLEAFQDSFRISLALGKVLIDRARVGICGPESIQIAFPDQDRLHRVLSEEKGVILMNAHVGGWQVILPALQRLGRPVHMLLERDVQDVDLHYFEHGGDALPFQIIDPRGFLGGSLEMLGALNRGEILCVMGDRIFGSPKNLILMEFLGKPALFPFSAFKIASSSGAPMVLFFSHRVSPDRYVLEIPDVIRVPGNLGRSGQAFRPHVERFVRALEDYTRAHPYQFFNFYDMGS